MIYSRSRTPAFFAIAIVALAGNTASAAICDELSPQQYPGRWAVAPLDCAAGTEAACAQVVHDLMACAKAAGIEVMSPGGLTAVVDEEAVRAVLGSGDMSQVRKLGDLVPAQYLVMGEVRKGDAGLSGVLRLVVLAEGRIVAGTKLTLTDTGEVAARAAEQQVKIATGEAREESVEVGMRLLADRLAEGFGKVDRQTRYKRVAVLDFVNNSPRATQQGLGRLVAAELVTRLTTDHKIIVVERSRLDKVLQEIVLAQQGVLDEKSAPEVGKLVEADAIILGTVSELGASFVVHAQVVEVETALTVVAESVAFKAEGLITLASEALVLRTRGGAIYRALVVPGWGQFYNQQTNKAAVLSVSAGTFAVAALVTQLLANNAANKYSNAGAGADFDTLAGRVRGYQTARTSFLCALGAVWVYGIIDAYVNGVTFDSAVRAGGSSGQIFSPQPASF